MHEWSHLTGDRIVDPSSHFSWLNTIGVPIQDREIEAAPHKVVVLRGKVLKLLLWPEPLEGSVIAQREQHGNRETKKPKGSTEAQPSKWAVSEVVEAKAGSKH
jgi:hypothetical protein